MNQFCLFALLIGMFSSNFALAAGVIESASGQVRAGVSAAAASAVVLKQRIAAGTTLITGPQSRVTIRFDDGQAIVLNENSEFRVAEYSFTRDQPSKDRYGFELIKGALRSVTGPLTRRTPRAYALRTPTATMGIRGTDFMVAIVNPVYLRVLTGSIEITNSACSGTLDAGYAAVVANASTCAVTISLSALPAPIAATFSELAGLVVLVDGATLGAALATDAAEGALTMPMAIGIAGAIAAGIAAAAGRGGGNNITGTTGTR